jgi:hypothetical protein
MERQVHYVKEVPKELVVDMLHKFHYSKVLPRINKVFLGGYNDKHELVGVMTLGWGVRPLHTIRKLFPSLESKDYFEIGRMALDDKCPRNSETQFMSLCNKYVKQNYPHVKAIFTWADGMLGKAGYVYQAGNFLYGGFSWTDSYFTDTGEKVHPRMIVSKRGSRPKYEEVKAAGWSHYKGKQFRYITFLCSKTEKKRLIRESTVTWTIKGAPKEHDLAWKVKTDDGWVLSERPFYDKQSTNFYKSKKDKS